MIDEYLKLGLVNRLKITKKTPQGFYLSSLDEDSVLFPNKYITKDMVIGDVIDVFIYNDSKDRYIATTKIPKYKYNEFGVFKVVDVTKFGVFVDWGLEKDLFVPLSNIKKELQKNDFVIGKIVYDEKTDRLLLDTKIMRHIKKAKDYKKNDEVDILVIAKTPLGYKCIVDNLYEGMLFENEIFEHIRIGDKRKAYIKQNRNDGKLDLSLRKIGEGETQKIFNKLKHMKSTKITTKSSPEDIKKEFNVSKKMYKKAINELKAQNKIYQIDDVIYIKE